MITTAFDYGRDGSTCRAPMDIRGKEGCLGIHLDHGKGEEAMRLAQIEKKMVVYEPSSYKASDVYSKDRRYAILVVDMLEDFIRGVLKCERMVPKIPNVAAVISASRADGIPIVYCNDSHKPSDFELGRWVPHCMRGTKGGQVIKELSPHRSDYIVPKSTYSAFHDTELDEVLRALYSGKGANTLAIAGVTTDGCVKHTAADAFFKRYEVEVIEDAVDAFSEAQHEVSLQYIRFWYLSRVSSSKQFVKKLEA
jgi:nicotinamidase-related amidase